jgi:hypothetical protein
MKPTDGDPRITAALARMAMFRQADPSPLTLELYSAQLAGDGIPVEDVLVACDVLARRERAEGETTFPSYGTLTAECRRAGIARRARVREQERDVLRFPAPDPDQMRSLSPAEAKALAAELKARVEAKRAK